MPPSFQPCTPLGDIMLVNHAAQYFSSRSSLFSMCQQFCPVFRSYNNIIRPPPVFFLLSQGWTPSHCWGTQLSRCEALFTKAKVKVFLQSLKRISLSLCVSRTCCPCWTSPQTSTATTSRSPCTLRSTSDLPPSCVRPPPPQPLLLFNSSAPLLFLLLRVALFPCFAWLQLHCHKPVKDGGKHPTADT